MSYVADSFPIIVTMVPEFAIVALDIENALILK